MDSLKRLNIIKIQMAAQFTCLASKKLFANGSNFKMAWVFLNDYQFK